ncbi:2Fe-2S iron-sulfur cluster-binding protein [Streptomyces tendae]|uniref:2Fe-2S iron-sulfur cluster-binding protein n=1 Tax=Streptomyces tendae TaxID=1932 RepID=UPI00365BBEC2
MTDDQHGDEYGDQHGDRHTGGAPSGGGRWDPLPQGDYDDGATAFVKLPEGGVDALLASSESPLAAPGHGYVPPQITVAPATTAGTDPAATGSWAVPTAPSAPVDGTQWQVPDAGQDPAAHQGYGDYTAQQDPYGAAAPYDVNAGQDDRFGYRPGDTAQWDFSQASQAGTEAAAARPAPGQDVTGQWSIPVADGDLPDESGEFTTSSLAEQWGTGAPATLPGGAPAPWATQPTGQPWGEGAVPTAPADEERPAGSAHGHGPGVGGPGYGSTATSTEHEHGQGPDSGAGVGTGVGTGHESESTVGGHGPGPAAGPHRQHPTGPAYGHGPGVDGPGYGSTASGHEHGHGPDSGPDSGAGAGADHGPDSAVGPHGPHPTAPADALAAGADASRHGGEAGASPDGSHPGDGPYPHAPADAADPAVPVTDGPRGAEEAAEGPAGRSAGPAEEASAGAHPEGAEGPVTGPAPGAARERMPEPAREREHGQAPPAGPRPVSADGPRSSAAEVAGPAGQGTGPADAADARTVADGAETDAGATKAGPDPDGAPEPAAPAGPREEHPLTSYVLRVNGADRPVTDAWIGESLLYVLRERLGLAGAKDGCSQGECGACNVQVDGRLVASCLVPSVTAAGSEVRTVEGLAADGQPSDVQRALARRGAVQCGFCVPGMAMTVHNLLEGNPAPTELEARQALCGNLCRCSGYRGVLEAVQEVVAEREAHADADAQAGADSAEPRIPHQAGPGAGGVNPAAFDSPPPPGAQDAPGPHDQPPYGDHGTHGRDGGHA